MTFSAIIDWLDDRLNPIVVKELRQAVKSRMVVAILMLFLCLQLFLLGVFLLMREARGDMGVDWSAGSDAFMIQQVILLWTIAVVIPAYAAVRLGSERSDNNVDLMFSSTLRPSSIIWGKFFATFLLGMLVFSTCAPFMTFTYLLRGIDIPTILFVLGIDLLLMCFGIMAALFLAALPGARVLKFLYCFIGFIGLIVLTAIMTGGTLALIEGGGGFLEWLGDNWPVTLSFVAGVFGLIGLLFTYSVAIISPPSSNRMMPVRIFLVALCIVTLGGAFISTAYLSTGGRDFLPMVLFLIIMMPILCLQIWISVCEREHWGPRVARAIPRSLWLRPFAFLFYTGSAGGVIFSILLIAACLGGCAAWLEYVSTSSEMEMARRILIVHLLMALYAFCYAQSALLVRHYLLSNQIRPSYTWVIAGLLVGLGTTIPPVFAYFLFTNQMRYGNEVGWWFIANPFISYLEVVIDGGRRGGTRLDEFEFLCLWFLVTWAAIVSLLSVRWAVNQVCDFHPPRRKRIEEPVDAIILGEVSRVGANG